jgi:hypothetical protein
MGKKKGVKKNAGPTVSYTTEELFQILQKLTSNETSTVKEGEKLLSPFLQHHSCIGPLMTQVMGSPDLSVKMQAAILLKRKVSGHFGKFNAAEQAQLKMQLMQMVTSEPDKTVSVALSGAIASVAFATFSNNGSWDELFAGLMTLHKDPSEVLRARNYNILAQLAEKVSEHLKPHVTTIAQMLVLGCGDDHASVKVEAMQATTSFISNLSDSPEVMAFEPVMRPLFGVMQQCLQDNEQVVEEGLDVIQEAVTMEFPLVNGHIDALVPFVVHIIENADLETALKGSAAHTLVALVENRPKLISKANMVPPILQAMTNLIAQADPAKAGKLFVMGGNEKEGILEDEDEDFEEEESARLPGYILDAMAINIPSKFFVAPALQITASCMSSADSNQRKAGCALLGLIAEGCADHLRTILQQVLPPLLGSVQDQEYYVREVACFALGQMSEHCQPEILTFNQSVLPVIFQALDDPHQSIQTTICWVLEMFCEYLQPETLKPFLGPMLEKLCNLLNNPSRNIKEMALTAISATATASEKNFVPYTAQICGLLHPIIFLQGEKEETIRGRALESLSHISLAIGKEEFRPYFGESMRAAGQALKEDSDTLAEYVLVFFTNACKTMGDEFAGYLPEIMPFITDRLESDEIIKFAGSDDEDEEDEDGQAQIDNGDDEEYEDVDDDSDDDVYYAPEEGFVHAKKAGICCLGTFAESCPEQYYQYMSTSVPAVMEHGCKSIHESIQAESMETLSHFVKCAAVNAGIKEKPKMNVLVEPEPAAAEMFNTVVRTALLTLLTTIKMNKHKSVVGAALGATGEVLMNVGVIALNFDMTNADMKWSGAMANILMGLMLELLQEKAPCQVGVEAKEEEDEDDEDHDQHIPDALSELVGDLSRALGPQFLPIFDQFFPALLKYTKPSRSHSDRCMALGCFGDVVKELGPGAVKYAEAVLPAVQNGLGDQMESVRRNAAFCVGQLVAATNKLLVPHFPQILQLLAPLCQRSAESSTGDDGGADVDNALSAVCRLIREAPEAVPLGQVLPVILTALPLRADHDEGENIYDCLITVLQSGSPDVVPLFNDFITAFSAPLVASSKSTRTTKTMLQTAVQSMATSAQFSAPLQAAIAAVADEDAKTAVTAAANGTLVISEEDK